jgi:tetratricopeptide (TPR) repeat protein
MSPRRPSPAFERRLDRANEQIYRNPSQARTQLNDLLASIPAGSIVRRACIIERLSIVERILGNFDFAARLARDAASGFEEVDDHAGLARAQVSLGNIEWNRGHLETALRHYEEAYAIRRRGSGFSATAGALASIANIHVAMGRLSEARDEYEQALELAHQASDKRIIFRTENNLAECLLLMGHPSTALDHARTALTTCRKLSDRSDEPSVLINLSRILAKLKIYDEALTHVRLAVKVAQEMGDLFSHAAGLSLLAAQLHNHPASAGEESPEDLEDQAFLEAAKIGAHGLQKTIGDQAIAAARELKNSARARDYQKRLETITPS